MYRIQNISAWSSPLRRDLALRTLAGRSGGRSAGSSTLYRRTGWREITTMSYIHSLRSQLCPSSTHSGHNYVLHPLTQVTTMSCIHSLRSQLCPTSTHSGHNYVLHLLTQVTTTCMYLLLQKLRQDLISISLIRSELCLKST
jgi:hypothetical protein